MIASTPTPTRHPLVVTEALLVRAPTAAAMLGISVRALRRLDSVCAIPQAIKLGGMKSKLWRVRSLAEWCDDGCPSRDRLNGNAASAGRLVRQRTTGVPDDSNP